jgi:RHS repeat-associated protein
VFVMGGGGPGNGSGGPGGNGNGDGQGGDGQNGGNGANGGGKNAASCGPGSGGGCPNPSHGGGGTQAGDPIDPVTGRAYTVAVVDLALPGPLPLVVRRSYSTGSLDLDVGLGPGWSHSLSWTIEERRRTLRVHEPAAAPTEADLPAIGGSTRLPCGVLTRHAWGYTLEERGRLRVFGARAGRKVLLTRIVDRNDNAIELAYEPGGLARVVDSAGRVVRVRRRPNGRIAAFEVQNPAEGRFQAFRYYEYDEAGRLEAAIDSEGHAERYAYDDANRLIRRVEPGGLVAELRYDRQGRAVEGYCLRPGNDALDADVPALLADGVTPAKGFLHVKLDYGVGTTHVVTSRATRRVDGNALHKADKVVFAGGVHTQRFDAAGEVVEYADALGSTWRLERDPDGRLLAETDPLAARTEYGYGADGLVEEMRDAAGGRARYAYDARGNLASIEDAAGLVAAFRYDDRGLMVEATLPNGGVTRMRYDDLGNRVEIVEPDGSARHIRYDFLGRPTSFVDAMGQETSYAYDARGQLTAKRGPSGATVSYAYDPDGLPTAITDAEGRTTHLAWGGLRVVTEVRKPDGHVLRYRYDREQDLVRIVNERGEEHRLVRWSEGRVVEEHTFDGRRLRYRHDALGRVTGIDHGEGWIAIAYDALGRVLERVYPDESADRFAYDEVGRLVRVESGAVTTEYAYDAAGRVVSESTRHGERVDTTTYAYDAMGKVVRREGPGGTIEVSRDVMSRPIDVRWDGAGPVAFAYDPVGLEVSRTLPGGGRVESARTASGHVGRLDVLAARGPWGRPGEPEWVGAMPPDATLRRQYTWSAGGELVGVEDGRGRREELVRDANGRVLARRIQGGRGEAFSYGPTGDVAAAGEVAAYDAGGRPARRGAVEYAYDAFGRVVEKRVPGEGTYRLEWLPSGRLRAVETPSGERVSYVYDAFARRIEKRVEARGGPAAVTRYSWDGDVLVREIRESASASGDPIVEERSYAVVPGAALPLGDRRIVDGEAEERRFYLFAPNGAADALVAADGAVLGELEPSLFGEVDPARDDLTPVRFLGHERDPETGLFYNRYRYYDPHSGAYLSPEPIGLEGSLRPYAYVDHYPVDAFDPDGRAMTCVIRRTDGTSMPPVQSGTRGRSVDDLHPAVRTALPPSTGRAEGDPVPTHGCAEPWALSAHLDDWERRNAPRTCRPDDPSWRSNLQNALGEIDPNGGIASNMDGTPRAACPNCSQTIPRLWALAGQMPPTNVIAPGFQQQNHPSRTNFHPTTPPSRDFSRNAAQNQMSNTNAYGQQNLGVWSHDGSQWRRRATA